MPVQSRSRPINAVPISGRQLDLPAGPIVHLQKAGDSDYVIGAFRRWAGYKNLGSDEATNDLVHFQHVLSFAGTETTGRTGIHAHLAHVHIVIPTSGRAVFSYDGVATEAVPGSVIVQHGGTVHDQFDYSYVAASDEENRQTPQTIDPLPASLPLQSFGFLEFFVPLKMANVEIIGSGDVTPEDAQTAWDHPYHALGAHYSIQQPGADTAQYRPVAMRGDLEARDADTWSSTNDLVATWIIRPAAADPSHEATVSLRITGEEGGVVILYMMSGSAKFRRKDGEHLTMSAGDTLTHGAGLVGDPFEFSQDMRLIRFFVSARASLLRERTQEEIDRLESTGSGIITARELRPPHDARPINCLHGQ
jgi:quercetin dioxygenase-like cupin family protein